MRLIRSKKAVGRSAKRARRVLLLGLLLPCCGSSDSSGPGEASNPPLSSKLSSLNVNLFEGRCTFACHSGGEFAAGGLDMSGDVHKALVDVAATSNKCDSGQWIRVVPESSAKSLLYLKLLAKTDANVEVCGDEMPNALDQPAISSEELSFVREWIDKGALDD